MLLPDKNVSSAYSNTRVNFILPSSSLFHPVLFWRPSLGANTRPVFGTETEQKNVSPSHTHTKNSSRKTNNPIPRTKTEAPSPEFNSHDFGSEGIRLKAEIDKGVD
ncbi:hypothetical protein CDAR_15291 [Caerostris darwini]|uniref:Uncharacterized protein n=1 Tax=Caerostris darwini TaxID=1538125 RepID=A0AAV4QM18_9ARAC|nr:hypothetical protein CDAR_15291 [Caerostris darwini]